MNTDEVFEWTLEKTFGTVMDSYLEIDRFIKTFTENDCSYHRYCRFGFRVEKGYINSSAKVFYKDTKSTVTVIIFKRNN